MDPGFTHIIHSAPVPSLFRGGKRKRNFKLCFRHPEQGNTDAPAFALEQWLPTCGSPYLSWSNNPFTGIA